MLRYHIVFLILSIISFALTAPVLVQEERQANVDVIMKRGDGDIAKLAEEYLTTWGKPIESSDTHTSLSTAPDPASSTTNPDPSCSPSMQSLGARGNCLGLKSSAQSVPNHGSTHGLADTVEASAPGLEWTTTNSLDTSMEAPSRTPALSWDYNMPWNGDESPRTFSGYSSENNMLDKALPPTKFSSHPGSPSFYSPTQTKIYPYSDPGTVAHSPWPGAGSPEELEDGVDHVPPPPPSPDSELTDPEHRLDHQSLSTVSQPDLAAAAYAAKGKATVSRRVSGIARDVGSAAQRKLQ